MRGEKLEAIRLGRNRPGACVDGAITRRLACGDVLPKSNIDRELRDGVKPFRRAFLMGGAVLVLLAVTLPVRAQTAVVAVDEENFRSDPGGDVLATLLQGTPLTLGGERGQWTQATLEAWIWGSSVAQQQRPDLNLLVNASGENLRATPNGERIGRAEGGMRLNLLETRGDWLRVRRTGWIWSASIDVRDDDDGPDPAAAAAAREAEAQAEAEAAAADARQPASQSAQSASQPASQPAGRPVAEGAGTRRFASVARSAVLLDNPAGDTVATMRPGATVEVVARDGEWSRVRVEGWTVSGAFESGDATSRAVLREISRDSLQAHPEGHRGRLVEWTLQFITVQEAERFRTDFIEGETFMLTRGPGDDPGFVYVVVGADMMERVRSLSPLEQVRVLARVRTARSALTGAPVLDLLDITGR